MTTRELYKRFMSLCHKWPKDETKAGRDYGEVFRQQLMDHFPQGELGQVKDIKTVEATLSALERIANNNYFNENPLKRSSASGLEAFACKEAVSNEGIQIIHEDNENTILNRLKQTLSMNFLQSQANQPKTHLQIEGESNVSDKKNKDSQKDSRSD